jgi:small-conductance mechanosensitive channel
VESWKNPASRWKPCCAASTRPSRNGAAASENPDGELARLLRAGGAHRSQDHGRRSARARAAKSRRRFTLDELRAYLESNAAALREPYPEIAAISPRLAAEAEAHYQDLEGLEQRLTVLEEKMIAAARAQQSEDNLLESRRELDASYAPTAAK